jgi:hypothetical protein
MTLTVREMTLAGTGIIIDYFQGATPEYLEMLGVDPTLLPTPEGWRERFQRHFALPVEKRISLSVIWLSDDRAIGFSTADKIIYSERRACTCTSPNRTCGIRASASSACGAALTSISNG